MERIRSVFDDLFSWLNPKADKRFDMRRSVDMRKPIDRYLTVAMARLGFFRERRGMYCSPMGTDVTGVATFPEKLWACVKWEFFPNVGARHDGVNRLFCELSHLSKSDRSLGLLRANLIMNVGYVTPAHRHSAWSFPFAADPQPIVEDMVAAIQTYGLPFIRLLSKGPTFREALKSGQYSLANRDHDLPVFYVVEGDYSMAEVYLRESLEKRANRNDPEAERYRTFAARLRKLISERKQGP